MQIAPVGISPEGCRIYPIEAVFVRLKLGASGRAQVRRMTGSTIREGDMIRGWHPKIVSWRRAKRLAENGGRQPSEFRCKDGTVWRSYYHGPHWMFDYKGGF